MDEHDEARALRAEIREDRKLLRRAAETLAEIDRGAGLSDAHADVLAALRIRIEGRRRASLDDLLSAAGDIGGTKRDLGDAVGGDAEPSSEWPTIQDRKRDWPSL
jgi:hypothetical protein